MSAVNMENIIDALGDKLVEKMKGNIKADLAGVLRDGGLGDLLIAAVGQLQGTKGTPTPAAAPKTVLATTNAPKADDDDYELPQKKAASKKTLRQGPGVNIDHCLAPACKELHTGPRFSFLCIAHRSAPKATIRNWQAMAAELRKKAKKADKK